MASAGASISASGFNNLFARLEAVRKNHYSLGNLSTAERTNLGTAYSTSVASVGAKPVPSNITTLRNNLNNLSNSPYISSTFASNITVPSTGALMFASTLTTIENQVAAVEAICANCAFFTSAANQSHFSSNHSSNFGSNFSSATNRGHFSTNFTENNQKGNWSSASNRGNFSSNFRSNNSSNFTANFSSSSMQMW